MHTYISSTVLPAILQGHLYCNHEQQHGFVHSHPVASITDRHKLRNASSLTVSNSVTFNSLLLFQYVTHLIAGANWTISCIYSFCASHFLAMVLLANCLKSINILFHPCLSLKGVVRRTFEGLWGIISTVGNKFPGSWGYPNFEQGPGVRGAVVVSQAAFEYKQLPYAALNFVAGLEMTWSVSWDEYHAIIDGNGCYCNHWVLFVFVCWGKEQSSHRVWHKTNVVWDCMDGLLKWMIVNVSASKSLAKQARLLMFRFMKWCMLQTMVIPIQLSWETKLVTIVETANIETCRKSWKSVAHQGTDSRFNGWPQWPHPQKDLALQLPRIVMFHVQVLLPTWVLLLPVRLRPWRVLLCPVPCLLLNWLPCFLICLLRMILLQATTTLPWVHHTFTLVVCDWWHLMLSRSAVSCTVEANKVVANNSSHVHDPWNSIIF